MAARASFSNDSRIVKMPLPKSLLLKDYLLDDLSSCSSNGFKSYPRRQCFTTVGYLIEIDLNKHMKLPPTQKQFLKRKSKEKRKPKLKSKLKSKSKSVSVLHKASAAVVNVFKQFQFSGSGKPRKTCFLPRNLSRKLSKHGFWKKTSNHQNKHFERLKSFDDSIKEKENILPPSSTAVTTTTTTTSNSNSNSNSSASSDSYFTATSDSSTTGSSSKINVAQYDVEESEQQATEKKKNKANGKKVGGATTTATNTNDSAANGNAKNKESEQFSPVSVMDFPSDDEDEVTSPFKRSRVYAKGRKQKLMPKVRRSNNRAQLEPIRLEDRIALSESKTHDSTLESSLQTGLELSQVENQIEKKAVALLQLLKATMPSHNLFESSVIDNVLLAFFIEQINQGNVSNLAILQEAKDWMNGNEREMLESQNYKITYIKDMEKKGVNWLKYDDEEVSLELECEVFTSLVDEMLLEFYF